MSDTKETITNFAKTDARGKRVKFGIKAEDRTKHVYVIGKTGMGKSTLLENMAVQDIQNGEGFAFIDPHGATAEKLLEYIPEERMKDVLYFAPFDLDYPVPFNILEDIGEDKRHLVVNGLMSTFEKLWADQWSARMSYILQNTLAALLEFPGSTLLGVNRMYTDKVYRKKVMDSLKDASTKSFWFDEYSKFTDRYAAEATPAIQNKIGQFTSNPLIRNVIGQSESAFDIREIMDKKKILIVNLSKGKVGEGNANILGSMLITRIYLAAMSRADVSASKLKKLPNFYLYVDEFQSFANKSFENILSEARKYKLNLTIAHQYIEQMEDEVRNAVFGNIGTMITFRVGAYDADVLEKEFAPTFYAQDLVSLGFAQIYLKLMIDGISSAPFSATTLPPLSVPESASVEQVIASSREQYARKRSEVEEEIRAWHEPMETAPKPPLNKSSKSPQGSFNKDKHTSTKPYIKPNAQTQTRQDTSFEKKQNTLSLNDLKKVTKEYAGKHTPQITRRPEPPKPSHDKRAHNTNKEPTVKNKNELRDALSDVLKVPKPSTVVEKVSEPQKVQEKIIEKPQVKIRENISEKPQEKPQERQKEKSHLNTQERQKASVLKEISEDKLRKMLDVDETR